MIIGTTAEQIKTRLEQTFDKCGDFNMRPLISAGQTLYLANIGNFSGRDFISENVIKPILSAGKPITDDNAFLGILYANEAAAVGSFEGLCEKLLAGFAAVFTDTPAGVAAYACMARNDPGRSVSEPNNEVVVRGPREGFIEKAEDNVALLRKRLRTPAMKVLSFQLGDYSDVSVKLVYIDGIADARLVEDLSARISGMKLPSVMDSGYIEQFLISGSPRLFTEIGNSEKPDKVAAKLTSGRVAIICDGSPVVLTAPYLFVESLQSAEDYLKTPYYATFIRLIRFASMLISLFLPAFYVAVMEFHKNAVPYTLYSAMTDARKNVPFSLFGELIVILLIFELIREVGVRMPGAVGSAVSIVGGLILGDAAISAGISSAPVIMVASLTAITTFILPPYMNSTVLVRLAAIIAARLFGIVGIALCLTFLLIHLCGKTSFGVPYMSPFAPVSVAGANDALFMRPRTALKNSAKEPENR